MKNQISTRQFPKKIQDNILLDKKRTNSSFCFFHIQGYQQKILNENAYFPKLILI